MLASTLLAVLGCITALAAAQFPPPPADTKYYYFRTSLEPGQDAAKARFEKQYLYSYHTGAGLGDAAFVKDTPYEAHKGWFNGTYLNWFQPTSNNSIYFGFGLGYLADPYASWQPAYINGGQSSTDGLALDAQNKLVFTDDRNGTFASLFNGYLICDWWHNVPQLYWKTRNITASSLPVGCASVYLLAEPAPNTL